MKNLIYIMLLVGAFSCEQVTDIEVPAHTPQLVLSSYYYSGDTDVVAYVTKSAGILEDEEEVGVVPDATVLIFEEENLFHTLVYNVDFERYESIGMPAWDTDKTYRIEVSAEGFTTISATQQFPTFVPILDFTYEPEGGRNLDGEIRDKLEIEFQDPPGEQYYEIRVVGVDAQYGVEFNRFYESLDPLLEPGFQFYLFEDKPISEDTYNLVILAYPTNLDFENLRVELHSVSEDYFRFSKSLRAQELAKDNPFAEPVILPTNIENGQGIFSVSNYSFEEL